MSYRLSEDQIDEILDALLPASVKSTLESLGVSLTCDVCGGHTVPLSADDEGVCEGCS